MVLDNDKLIPVEDFLVKPNQKVNLPKISTEYNGKVLDKSIATQMLEEGRKHLGEMQDVLYAHNQFRVLIIFQGMDAAGKDGAVKHIMTGFNPLGVKVYSFKAPNSTELEHDYFWRHYQALPARGEIAIHNRSHYENVLVTRVHPEYILRENLPGIDSIDKITHDFWQNRYRQIRQFEQNLAENGTIILKFFLHLSKEEQKKRFLERIEDPSKNWKFSVNDLAERAFWDKYQEAFDNMLENTSTNYAPWFIIPADDKWFSRLLIASIIYRQFNKLNLSYPQISDAQKAQLLKAKEQLDKE